MYVFRSDLYCTALYISWEAQQAMRVQVLSVGENEELESCFVCKSQPSLFRCNAYLLRDQPPNSMLMYHLDLKLLVCKATNFLRILPRFKEGDQSYLNRILFVY